MVRQLTALNTSDLLSSLQDLACVRVKFLIHSDGITLFFTVRALQSGLRMAHLLRQGQQQGAARQAPWSWRPREVDRESA